MPKPSKTTEALIEEYKATYRRVRNRDIKVELKAGGVIVLTVDSTALKVRVCDLPGMIKNLNKQW
jgi:hypothetical protein